MQNKLTFKELALLAMQMVNRPMTPTALWEFVVQNHLHQRLHCFDETTQTFTAKTPEASFGACIYTNKEFFQGVVGSKPKQFILKHPIQQPNDLVAVQPAKHEVKKKFHERDLHCVLSYFLQHHEYFQAYSKTIFHEESQKGQKGEDKWLYPDMVAVNFEYANYRKNNVLKFINKFDISPIKIFSFELKKELNYSNYKEYFFQAVSNSSWANEGYLVALGIKQDHQFIEALQKLSQSFGIGVIELNLSNILESKILSPARYKEKMDYAVIDELAVKNSHFAQFLKTVTDFEPDNPQRFEREFDHILSDEALSDYLRDRLAVE